MDHPAGTVYTGRPGSRINAKRIQQENSGGPGGKSSSAEEKRPEKEKELLNWRGWPSEKKRGKA